MGRTYLEKKKKTLKSLKKKYWRAKRALKRKICVFLFLFGRDLVKGQLLKGNFLANQNKNIISNETFFPFFQNTMLQTFGPYFIQIG